MTHTDGSGVLLSKETRRLRRSGPFAPHRLVKDAEESEIGRLVSGCQDAALNDFLATVVSFVTGASPDRLRLV